MPSSFDLFLPLVAGFFFLRFFNVTRYVSQTWDGPRLIFWSATAGILFIIVSRATVIWAFGESEFGGNLRDALYELFPTQNIGTLSGCLILGVLSPFLFNLIFSPSRSARITERWADLFIRLLSDEVGSGRAIAVTLSDEKVYIGFVLSKPSLDPAEKYFKLLPTLSGYREPDTKRLKIATNYGKTIEAVRHHLPPTEGYDLEDLQIILPLEHVISARLFETKVFTKIFSEVVPELEEEAQAELDEGW